ncbi:hypothetical protein LTR56_011781 [Elasticomyces elasticus]|nr:hypothetical protein LTR56_011781 [Elasticomyces elasticus]KAK3663315.1 hypothetical protein LTR22_005973 [Elasticomyces elasticus]KAK4929029.1 hypothetical protein LTR49_004226 [Elasticomyces elasticus]KAK5750369.1 hypothetical protein LTS12_019555 [Elasticomyces elasticus]
MATKTYVHVVKKASIAEHASIQVDLPEPPALSRGQVRARPVLFSLTYNTLTYARMGTLLKWWDAFPVPDALPAPYGDQSQYGITPCWGYGECLESQISDISPGQLLFGYWPLSGHPVDLTLVEADMQGHLKDVSEQRKSLMTIYNRYFVRDPAMRLSELSEAKVDAMAREAVYRPVWECGYLLNRFNLSEPYVHPHGSTGPPDQSWSAAKGDLASAVVIVHGGGGRTAQAFLDGLINNRDKGSGPLALLVITGSPSATAIKAAEFPARAINYAAISEKSTMAWVLEQQPKKVVIVDLGGRGKSSADLGEAIKTHTAGIEALTIGVGGEPKAEAFDVTMLAQYRQGGLPNRVQMNTGPIRDALIETMGAEAYFKIVSKAWEAFVERGNMDDLDIIWGRRVDGPDGVEGGWNTVCKGEMPANSAFVYRL